MIYSVIRYNDYQDSVVMMSLSTKVRKVPGVIDAAVMMGTNLNKQFLGSANLLTKEVEKTTPNDLCICVEADAKETFDLVLQEIDEYFNRRIDSNSSISLPQNIEEAVKRNSDVNLALISVPGEYAAFEAEKALNQNLNVFLFSDNVYIEDEIRLKRIATDKGLLMMGPDCGTAILNGVGLGFANAIKEGPIGIIGASGTGIQEVIKSISKNNCGISQAIGTGGRDLSKEVGGIEFLFALENLLDDEKTEVLILISKPPDRIIYEKILDKIELAKTKKPIVICFPGFEAKSTGQTGVFYANTLSHAGDLAVALLNNEDLRPADIEIEFNDEVWELIAHETSQKKLPSQKYIRGLFSGGTLCDETAYILGQNLDHVYSNQSFGNILKIQDFSQPVGNNVIDLGDDFFTKGKPHPMIDPTDRVERIILEAKKLEAKVLLLDVVLGYGSHEDPAGELAKAINEAKSIIKSEGGYLSVVVSVCGTGEDKQGYQSQIDKLQQSGAVVMPSNSTAAKFASIVCLRD